MNQTIKRIAVVAAAATLLILTTTQSAPAQSGGMQSQAPAAPMSPFAALNPANWRMPQWKMPSFRQLLPGQDEKARIKKKKDSLYDEVTKTASNSWNKTKQAFNPQKLNPTRFFQASARMPSSTRPQETKPGFFRSLFAPPPPAQDNNSTVTDFLRQSRPSP